jgi:hypothetical protein
MSQSFSAEGPTRPESEPDRKAAQKAAKKADKKAAKAKAKRIRDLGSRGRR